MTDEERIEELTRNCIIALKRQVLANLGWRGGPTAPYRTQLDFMADEVEALGAALAEIFAAHIKDESAQAEKGAV